MEAIWPSPQFINPIVLMPIVLNRFTAVLIRPCYRKEAVRTHTIQMDDVKGSDILVS